jgi:NADPH:quinone reductase-like Zn-dependent oxidoreductase
MLRSIGADQVIDYTQEDFTRRGETYDAIIDVVGKSPFSGCLRSLKQNGRYVLGNPRPWGMIRGRWTSMTTNKTVIFESARHSAEEYSFLRGLIEAGKIKPVIDRRYPLEQIDEAHRYVETGQKKGKCSHHCGTSYICLIYKRGFGNLFKLLQGQVDCHWLLGVVS